MTTQVKVGRGLPCAREAPGPETVTVPWEVSRSRHPSKASQASESGCWPLHCRSHLLCGDRLTGHARAEGGAGEGPPATRRALQ